MGMHTGRTKLSLLHKASLAFKLWVRGHPRLCVWHQWLLNRQWSLWYNHTFFKVERMKQSQKEAIWMFMEFGVFVVILFFPQQADIYALLWVYFHIKSGLGTHYTGLNCLENSKVGCSEHSSHHGKDNVSGKSDTSNSTAENKKKFYCWHNISLWNGQSTEWACKHLHLKVSKLSLQSTVWLSLFLALVACLDRLQGDRLTGTFIN